MVIIELTYIKPISDVEHFLKAHIQFLEKYYDQGVFIASGRKVPRDGGVILAMTDKASAAEIIKEDPFHQEGISEYHLIEFEPSKHDPRMSDIFA
ncbi:MAG: YciI family protein [Gammaproteobacteria bacterium]|nr:YciI family protein [Gammaproteobacteria bacterium]